MKHLTDDYTRIHNVIQADKSFMNIHGRTASVPTVNCLVPISLRMESVQIADMLVPTTGITVSALSVTNSVNITSRMVFVPSVQESVFTDTTRAPA